MKIALVSCVKEKGDKACKAKDLYTSQLFTKSYKYAADVLKVDKIYILSAKYGLLDENDVIESYEFTLNGQKKSFRQDWAKRVVEQMSREFDLDNDEFYILAGKNYYEFILPHLTKAHLPYDGRKFGMILQFLKEELNKLPK